MPDLSSKSAASNSSANRDLVKDWFFRTLSTRYLINPIRITESNNLADWGYAGPDRIADLAAEFNGAVATYGWLLAPVTPLELKKALVSSDGSVAALLDFLSQELKKISNEAQDVFERLEEYVSEYLETIQQPPKSELKTATIECLRPILELDDHTPDNTDITPFLLSGQERQQFVGCINGKYWQHSRMRSVMTEMDLASRLHPAHNFGELVKFVQHKVWGVIP